MMEITVLDVVMHSCYLSEILSEHSLRQPVDRLLKCNVSEGHLFISFSIVLRGLCYILSKRCWNKFIKLQVFLALPFVL